MSFSGNIYKELCCSCIYIHSSFDTESLHFLYLGTGDISSGLDTPSKMTESLTGYEEICSCLSMLILRWPGGRGNFTQPHLDERVTGSNHRCCALQQDTSSLNSVNGFQECESARLDQRSQPIRILFTLYLLERLWLSHPGLSAELWRRCKLCY